MFSDKQILKYIDYFSNDKIEFCKWVNPERQEDGTIATGYPVYDEGVRKFIDDIYKSDLIDGKYLDNLKKYDIEALTPEGLIETADIGLLKSILTYYVRQERFCIGAWAEAINKKIFLKVLVRLKELKEN